jgi:hypothetical protein
MRALHCTSSSPPPSRSCCIPLAYSEFERVTDGDRTREPSQSHKLLVRVQGRSKRHCARLRGIPRESVCSKAAVLSASPARPSKNGKGHFGYVAEPAAMGPQMDELAPQSSRACTRPPRSRCRQPLRKRGRKPTSHGAGASRPGPFAFTPSDPTSENTPSAQPGD